MIDYFLLNYEIKFIDKIYWDKTPSMIFRSVLGLHLKKLSCVFKNKKCDDCLLNNSCVYANFFETPICKDKDILIGRNKAPHPFTLNVDLLDNNMINVSILFIGKSRNYIPYITLALERAGEQGVAKARTKFKINKIIHKNHLFNFEIDKLSEKIETWPNVSGNFEFDMVKFITPCRIKTKGHYIDFITANDFIEAMERRVLILDTLYGDNKFKLFKEDNLVIESVPLNQKWVDLRYYSSRQNKALKIGGVLGAFRIKSELNEYYKQIFKAAEIFNVGKNISMGLGKVSLLEEVQ